MARPPHGTGEGVTDLRGLGLRGPISATLTGVLELWRRRDTLPPVPDGLRLPGVTALVTGASSGLGQAVAIDLARRGARLILPLRGGIPAAGQEIARRSGAAVPLMLPVDLSDLDSVAALADALAQRGEAIDLFVGNAGLVPARAQRTRQGFEAMFCVHYLANHLLLRRLLATGVISRDRRGRPGRPGSGAPRIVLVASEAHRACAGLDFARFGAFQDYGIADGMRWYGYSKLAELTFALALSRRLMTPDGPAVAVHALCPGPVDSRLAREAPHRGAARSAPRARDDPRPERRRSCAAAIAAPRVRGGLPGCPPGRTAAAVAAGALDPARRALQRGRAAAAPRRSPVGQRASLQRLRQRPRQPRRKQRLAGRPQPIAAGLVARLRRGHRALHEVQVHPRLPGQLRRRREVQHRRRGDVRATKQRAHHQAQRRLRPARPTNLVLAWPRTL